MIDFILDCDNQTKILLEQYINQICEANYVDYQSIHDGFILLKEVNKAEDLQALKKINDLKYNCRLICIISDEQYIFDILDLHKTYFLRQSYIEKDICVIKDCINDFRNSRLGFIELIANYEHIIINVRTILYIESIAHNVIIHSTDGEFKSRRKLSDVFEQVKCYGFIQIHKSYIVNKKYISTIYSKEVSLSNAIKLPIGRKYNINIQKL